MAHKSLCPKMVMGQPVTTFANSNPFNWDDDQNRIFQIYLSAHPLPPKGSKEDIRQLIYDLNFGVYDGHTNQYGEDLMKKTKIKIMAKLKKLRAKGPKGKVRPVTRSGVWKQKRKMEDKGEGDNDDYDSLSTSRTLTNTTPSPGSSHFARYAPWQTSDPALGSSLRINNLNRARHSLSLSPIETWESETHGGMSKYLQSNAGLAMNSIPPIAQPVTAPLFPLLSASDLEAGNNYDLAAPGQDASNIGHTDTEVNPAMAAVLDTAASGPSSSWAVGATFPSGAVQARRTAAWITTSDPESTGTTMVGKERTSTAVSNGPILDESGVQLSTPSFFQATQSASASASTDLHPSSVSTVSTWGSPTSPTLYGSLPSFPRSVQATRHTSSHSSLALAPPISKLTTPSPCSATGADVNIAGVGSVSKGECEAGYLSDPDIFADSG
ncbi:hypothetical protein BKA65DRAFT_557487 [Rhexocercosporidium sp. MPI-PUGE-AT-0058]|nr:hypothetical protein BKA65DRAFT_557487 [Rhexocercosporidium sp. MPI-PUGE-AT-0058]